MKKQDKNIMSASATLGGHNEILGRPLPHATHRFRREAITFTQLTVGSIGVVSVLKRIEVKDAHE